MTVATANDSHQFFLSVCQVDFVVVTTGLLELTMTAFDLHVSTRNTR